LLQECFDPIVDAVSGRDLIRAMVYGLETTFKAFVLSHFFSSIFIIYPSQLMYPSHTERVCGVKSLEECIVHY